MEENISTENISPEPVVSAETPEIIPEIPVVEKKKKPWINIVILLIVILLGCAGLVFAGVQIQKNQASNQSTPSPEVTVTPTFDLIAEWKTYSSDEYGFSFKYPKDWVVEDTPIGDAPSSLFKKGTIPLRTEITSSGEEKTGISINPEGGSTININPRMNFIETVIGGKKARLYTFSPDTGFRFYNLVDDKNYPNFSITLSDARLNELIVSQIVSTFKFLDETEKVDVSNWKTFNKYPEFSFKYPADKFNLTDRFEVGEESNWVGYDVIEIFSKEYELAAQYPRVSLGALRTQKTIQEYIDSSFQKELKGWQDFTKEDEDYRDAPNPKIESVVDVNNGFIFAKKVLRTRTPNRPDSGETQYLFKKGDILYLLYANYGSSDLDTKEKENLDLIFSTFKLSN